MTHATQGGFLTQVVAAVVNTARSFYPMRPDAPEALSIDGAIELLYGATNEIGNAVAEQAGQLDRWLATSDLGSLHRQTNYARTTCDVLVREIKLRKLAIGTLAELLNLQLLGAPQTIDNILIHVGEALKGIPFGSYSPDAVVAVTALLQGLLYED